jgi:hypothetical protein
MATILFLAARNFEDKEVPCTFAVTADGTVLPPASPGARQYQLPAAATAVTITAKPTTKTHWETTIQFTVTSGILVPAANQRAFAAVVPVVVGVPQLLLVGIRLSRFKEVTTKVFDLLKTVPVPRGERAPPESELKGTYGGWPPADWDVKDLPQASYLDAKTPVTSGALNFARDSALKVDVENVVLELAGEAPRLLGVTWPKAIAPKDGADPTRMLLFLRQTGGQDAKYGVFTGGAVKTQPYPYNFDYAERCLFESLHYADAPDTPLFQAIGFTLRPKGVPYQVAKSGAKAVTVFPVANGADSIAFGELAHMNRAGKILEELQAFMFWRAGVSFHPASLGNVAIAAYSSANKRMVEWLGAPRNLTSTFLKQTVKAIYFLDPPDVVGAVGAGLAWTRRTGNDKRVRLYSRLPEPQKTPDLTEAHKKAVNAAFRELLGWKASDPLPARPFFKTSPDTKRSVGAFDLASWVKTFKNVRGVDVVLKWWDVHHFIPASALTHALAQGDLS